MMQLFEQIRTRIHDYLLKKELPLRKIRHSSMYLDNAATVGILFDGTRLEDREMVLDYAKRLEQEGKKVKLLAFFDSKLKSESFTFKHFNRKDLDWALRPVSQDAKEFAEQPFDLLLHLSQKEVLPLDCIAARSRAKFRVGPLTEKTFCYDLMIDLSGKKDLKAFIHQVVFYMKKMRPEHEAAAAI